MANIVDIEGIGAAYAEKLTAAGANTTEKLLELGAAPTGRKALAEKVGCTERQILEWVNRADLMRVKGVGSEYGDLLEAAGVDSPKELAQRVAANLAAKMSELNESKKLVRRVPTETEVAAWIEHAKTLPQVVTH